LSNPEFRDTEWPCEDKLWANFYWKLNDISRSLKGVSCWLISKCQIWLQIATQSRTPVSPWRMHCMYCGMPKSTSRIEATSNSEKNQACSLSLYQVTLVWRRQLVNTSFQIKIWYAFKKSCYGILKKNVFDGIFYWLTDWLGLSYT